MAYENVKVLPGTHLADADLSAKQHYAVKASSTGIALWGDGEAAIGFLQNKPISGEQCAIGFEGISKAVAGGTFARGAILASDANGKLITAASGKHGVAIALEAGVDTQVVSVALIRNGLQA